MLVLPGLGVVCPRLAITVLPTIAFGILAVGVCPTVVIEFALIGCAVAGLLVLTVCAAGAGAGVFFGAGATDGAVALAVFFDTSIGFVPYLSPA